MSHETFKYCDRCGELFKLCDNYSSVKLLDRNRLKNSFISRCQMYTTADWCDKCIDLLMDLLDKFKEETDGM